MGDGGAVGRIGLCCDFGALGRGPSRIASVAANSEVMLVLAVRRSAVHRCALRVTTVSMLLQALCMTVAANGLSVNTHIVQSGKGTQAGADKYQCHRGGP